MERSHDKRLRFEHSRTILYPVENRAFQIVQVARTVALHRVSRRQHQRAGYRLAGPETPPTPARQDAVGDGGRAIRGNALRRAHRGECGDTDRYTSSACSALDPRAHARPRHVSVQDVELRPDVVRVRRTRQRHHARVRV